MGVAGALAGVAVKASIGAAALGVTLVAALAVFQRKIMYFPQAGTIPPPPERLKAPYNEIEDVEVVTEDGVRIKLWYWAAQEGARGFVTPETAKSREKTAMLLFHGNAGSRADRAQWALQLRQLHGVAVCLVDYRGYGGSEGEPTEAGMRADSRAALKWLRETKRPEKIVLLGESIGTCVSVALAEEEGPGGVDALILNAALTSITEVAASIYPFLKPCLKLLLRDKWDSLGKINKVRPRTEPCQHATRRWRVSRARRSALGCESGSRPCVLRSAAPMERRTRARASCCVVCGRRGTAANG